MYNLLTSSGSAIISVIALFFVLGFALYGLIKGFAKTFVAMFGTILSITFAIILCTTVASFLESKFSFISSMADSLSSTIGNVFGKETMDMPLIYATEESIKSAGANKLLVKIALSIKKDTIYPIGTTLGQVLSPTFAYYITLIISAIGLFIVFELIFIVIGNIVRKNYKIKLVEKVDRTLGFALGLLSGILYFEAIVLIIGAIPLSITQNLHVLIEESSIARVICTINPYDSILSLISYNKISNFVYSLI